MPLFGQLEMQTVLSSLPEMVDFETEAWDLPGAELLYLAFEVPSEVADQWLPRAMHPAVPRYVTVLVSQFPETPVGPFRLAQLRLMGRAGVHPRGYVVHAYANQPDAVTELRRRWGFPVQAADDIVLRVRHDRVFAAVLQAGRTLLDCGLSHYEVVAGTDINFISSVHLAQVTGLATPGPRLVQVDPRYTIHRAERGRPVLNHLEAAAWSCDDLRVVNPMVATFTQVDTDLPQIRFVMDPEIPVSEGTTRVH